jgi:hypothetical protein
MKTMDATLLVVRWQREVGCPIYWQRDAGWVESPQKASCFHDEPKARANAEAIADTLATAHKGRVDVVEVPVVIDFTCRVCGVECDVAPNPPERAVCPDHCSDHNYEYDKWERQHLCTLCNKIRPEDWSK